MRNSECRQIQRLLIVSVPGAAVPGTSSAHGRSRPSGRMRWSRDEARYGGSTARSALHCLLPTAYCLLPTAYCLLPTAYC
jgi:hypothetical protein